MGEFIQGVYVTILGMGLVFASLGLLMLTILGLQWILRERPRPQAGSVRLTPALATGSAVAAPALATGPAAPLVAVGAAPDEAGPSPEAVAAIAVALATWQRRRHAAQPPETTVITFAPDSSAWRAIGRLS